MALLMHTSSICSFYFIANSWGPDCSPSSEAPSLGCMQKKKKHNNQIRISTVTFDLYSVMAASEDALQELLPGLQLRPADREAERGRDWPVGLRDPHERRSHRGPSEGRGAPHEPARHRSLQPTEGATEPTGAARRQPGGGVHLLGTQQQHETGRERSRLQQPQTVEPNAAQTATLLHLSDQNVNIWRTVEKGNGDRQVNMSTQMLNSTLPFCKTWWSILEFQVSSLLAYQSKAH